MRVRSFALVAAVTGALALSAGCGNALDQLLGKDSPTPAGSGSLTPTPTNTVSSSPTPTPSVTTSGEVTTVDWGTVALPAGTSPTFKFTAPANTIGVELLAIGSAADASDVFIFFGVTSPTGTVIDGSGSGPEQQSGNSGLAAFSLPSSDSAAATVSAGNYTFHVAAFSSATGNPAVASHTHVMAKYRVRAGGLANTNILDLNIVGIEGADLTWTSLADGTTVQNTTLVQDSLTRMFADYSSANIVEGSVSYFLLKDPSFATISSEAQLEALFVQSASITGNNRPTIFLISGFSGDFAGGVAGIAGGIPTTNDVNGTLHSGVAIAMQSTARDTGDDMAHETGHSLGLYHTSEKDAVAFDPISDTPTCDATTQQANLNACPDGTNVMFWQLLQKTAPLSLTSGQRSVVAANIAIRSGSSFAPSQPLRFAAYEPETSISTPRLVLTCATMRRGSHPFSIPSEGLRAQ